MLDFLAINERGVSRAAHEAGGRWSTATVLPAADVRVLTADPHRPQTVFAGTNGSGVWRSADGGRSWR